MKQFIVATLTFAAVAILVLASSAAQPAIDTVRQLLAAGALLDINSPVWSLILALFAGVWIWLIATALRVNPDRVRDK